MNFWGENMKVLEQAKARGRAKVAVTDIDGVMRGKYLHPTKFESVLKGGFLDSVTWFGLGQQ